MPNLNRIWLGQLESDANSLGYLSPKRPVFVHLHVLVGDGALDDLAVSRLRVSGPILDQRARYVIGFKVSDPKAPETVKALLLDSKLFQCGVQVSPKEVGLIDGSTVARPEK